MKTLNDVTDTKKLSNSVWGMSAELLASKQPAITGKARITYTSHWGETEDLIETITNPTYTDLWVVADKLIRLSGDTHHVFIEDFMYNEKDDVWELATGS